MKKYAFSIMGTKIDKTRIMTHQIGLVDGVSDYEALGKANAIATKVFPSEKGWIDRSAIVINVEEATTNPENVGGD